MLNVGVVGALAGEMLEPAAATGQCVLPFVRWGALSGTPASACERLSAASFRKERRGPARALYGRLAAPDDISPITTQVPLHLGEVPFGFGVVGRLHNRRALREEELDAALFRAVDEGLVRRVLPVQQGVFDEYGSRTMSRNAPLIYSSTRSSARRAASHRRGAGAASSLLAGALLFAAASPASGSAAGSAAVASASSAFFLGA